MQYDYLFKIILLGDSGVGKSSLLRNFVHKQFSEGNKATIGADSETIDVNVIAFQIPKVAKLNIWDTAGQERFRSLSSMYVRGGRYALLVFSMVDLGSLQALEYWLEILETHKITNRVLIGNKCDMVHGFGGIASQTIEEFKQRHDIKHFITTSAKTGENVEKLFTAIATQLCEESITNRLKESANKKDVVYLPEKPEEPLKKRTCC
jgi:small GTP-binding protein